MPETYRFVRRGRRWTSVVILGLFWAVLAIMAVAFDAALWILALAAAASLPALVDLLRDTRAGLELSADRLSWFSGQRRAEVKHAEIERVRFDTRLDLSVRATLLLRSGQRLRLPFESTPPVTEFARALAAHDIATERHHFSPIG